MRFLIAATVMLSSTPLLAGARFDLSCKEFWSHRANGAVVIDVRTPEEFKSGHIEGALNIPKGEIADAIDTVVTDKSREIILYCRSGNRSGAAKEILTAKGYGNVKNAGGFRNLADCQPK